MSTVGIKAHPTGDGYWGVDSLGNVFAEGASRYMGTLASIGVPASDCVDLAPTPTGNGYWLLRTDGGGSVYTFGDAQFLGDPTLSAFVSGLVSNLAPGAGQGYWAFDNTGAVDAFGSAAYHGGSPGVTNIVAMVATSTGGGYWLIGQDGTTHAYGDAPGVGSLGAAFDIVGACPVPAGLGFWATDAIGGIYAEGDAIFNNSLPGLSISPSFFIADVCGTLDGGGQRCVDIAGNVYTIGDASYLGIA